MAVPEGYWCGSGLIFTDIQLINETSPNQKQGVVFITNMALHDTQLKYIYLLIDNHIF